MAQQESYEPTKSDIAQIVESAMEHAQAAGVPITVQNVEAREGRPAGLLVFFGGLAYQGAEGLVALDEESVAA